MASTMAPMTFSQPIRDGTGGAEGTHNYGEATILSTRPPASVQIPGIDRLLVGAGDWEREPQNQAGSFSSKSNMSGEDNAFIGVADFGDDMKKKRRQCSNACLLCARSKAACDDKRPCSRCLKHNDGKLCQERPGSSRYMAANAGGQNSQNALSGIMQKQRPAGVQKRRQIGKGLACLACTRSKTGCDGLRPCARCIRVNKGECVDKPRKSKVQGMSSASSNAGLMLSLFGNTFGGDGTGSGDISRATSSGSLDFGGFGRTMSDPGQSTSNTTSGISMHTQQNDMGFTRSYSSGNHPALYDQQPIFFGIASAGSMDEANSGGSEYSGKDISFVKPLPQVTYNSSQEFSRTTSTESVNSSNGYGLCNLNISSSKQHPSEGEPFSSSIGDQENARVHNGRMQAMGNAGDDVRQQQQQDERPGYSRSHSDILGQLFAAPQHQQQQQFFHRALLQPPSQSSMPSNASTVSNGHAGYQGTAANEEQDAHTQRQLQLQLQLHFQQQQQKQQQQQQQQGLNHHGQSGAPHSQQLHMWSQTRANPSQFRQVDMCQGMQQLHNGDQFQGQLYLDTPQMLQMQSQNSNTSSRMQYSNGSPMSSNSHAHMGTPTFRTGNNQAFSAGCAPQLDHQQQQQFQQFVETKQHQQQESSFYGSGFDQFASFQSQNITSTSHPLNPSVDRASAVTLSDNDNC
jgi:hypothetical protein